MGLTSNPERRELEITEAANEMTKRFSWRNGYATLVDAFIEGAKWADANPNAVPIIFIEEASLPAVPNFRPQGTISNHPKKTL